MSARASDNLPQTLPSAALNRDFGDTASLLGGFAAVDEDQHGITLHAVRVGNLGLLLPGDEISELVEGHKVCRLPNTADWFSGVTSVRGDMVPVFDLHALLGMDRDLAARRMIVVSEHERAVAFWIDGFPCLVNVADEDEMSGAPPMAPMIAEFARRYFLREEQIWIDWRIEDFFKYLGNRL